MTGRLTGPLPPLRRVIDEPATPTLARTAGFLAQIVRMVTRRDWRGQENVPRTGGLVVVANHISNADPLLLSHFLVYAGRWPRFLAKESLFRLPVIGRVLTACGQIPVRRGSSTAAASLEEAVAAVDAGRCVVIYPEGTITDRPGLWPMRGRTGAAGIQNDAVELLQRAHVAVRSLDGYRLAGESIVAGFGEQSFGMAVQTLGASGAALDDELHLAITWDG